MSEVEELANKYFEEQCEHTYADTVEQLKEDVVAAFLQGYAKGETDEKFRTKQVVTKDMAELIKENKELKILISSLVYEINQIWNINEMNDDLRRCAEKIDREVQLSKMAEDNRMVISALGFAVVPPKPKVDVKEI